MYRNCLVLFSLYLISGAAVAQTRITDSLRNKLHQTTGAARLQLLLALGHEQQSLNRDTAYQYALEAMSLAAKSDIRTKSFASLYFAQSYIPWGWLDSSVAVLEPVLGLNPVTDPATRDLYFLLNRQHAMIYAVRSHYKEALEILYRLISDAQRYKDSVSLGTNLNSIGSVSIAREEPFVALNWFYKALAFSTNDDRYLPVSTAIYINLANASLLLNRTDSTLFYLQKAIPLAKKIENLYLLNTALRIQTNTYIKAGRLKEAEVSFKETQAIRALTGESNVAEDNLSTVDFYISTNQLEKAILFCRQLLESTPGKMLAGSTSYITSAPLRLSFYEVLAKCYKLNGNDELYQQTLEKIILVKDSVYAAASTKEIADIQTKYETQIKENSIIENQRLDIIRKNYLFYGLLCLSVLAAVSAGFIFNENRRRQKIKMEAALKEQKRIADEAVRKAEEKERVRIAADLHDNLGAYAASMASNLNYLRIDEQNEGVKNAFRELKNNSGSMIAELNDTIWVLKKENLSLTAISDRIKIFISRLRKSYPEVSIEVKEKITNDFLFTASQAFHLYRIVQEAVNNALKHSKGNSIEIGILSGSSWQFIITDNGTGMIREVTKESNGLGNMRARCRENDWHIQWIAAAPHGTQVKISPTSN